MGATATKDELLRDVSKRSKFSLRELTQWYDKFVVDYPCGAVNEAEFKVLYGKFYTKGKSDEFSAETFRMFDRDEDGKINFREFMVSVGIQSRGTAEEKMEWIFNLFDIDMNRVVTKKEMITVLGELYKAADDKDFKTTAKEKTDQIYEKLDQNADGKLTFDEFVKLSNTDPKLMNMIVGFNQ